MRYPTGIEDIDKQIERGETRGCFDGGTMGGKWWFDDDGEIDIKHTWYDVDWENAEPIEGLMIDYYERQMEEKDAL